MSKIHEIEKELKELTKKQNELQDELRKKRELLKQLKPSKCKYSDYKKAFNDFGIKITKRSQYYTLEKTTRLLALVNIKPESESNKILDNLLTLLEMLNSFNEHLDGILTINSLPNDLRYDRFHIIIKYNNFIMYLRANFDGVNVVGNLTCSKSLERNSYVIEENKKYTKLISTSSEEELQIDWEYFISTTKDNFEVDCFNAIEDLINIVSADFEYYG